MTSTETICDAFQVKNARSNARTRAWDVHHILRPTKSNVDNFDHNYDFNAKVIVIGLRVKRSHNFIPRVMRK